MANACAMCGWPLHPGACMATIFRKDGEFPWPPIMSGAFDAADIDAVQEGAQAIVAAALASRSDGEGSLSDEELATVKRLDNLAGRLLAYIQLASLGEPV